MAIVITGKSECPLCGQVLNDFDEIVLFPPFAPNTKDPFSIFNDGGVHKQCLKQHPLGARAIEYWNRAVMHNKICDVAGTEIRHPEDFIGIVLLTSNMDEPLSRFNFMTIDKKNLAIWQDRQLFLDTATKYLNDGKWGSVSDFNYLRYLINEIGH